MSRVLLDAHYYASQLNVQFTPSKLAARMRNAKSRLRIVRRFCDTTRLLDIGTGEGVFLAAMRERGLPVGIGIEPNERAAAHARSQGLDVRLGDLAEIPGFLAEIRPTCVTMFHVIEHLEDPLGDLVRIRENLPSGSMIVIETPNLKGFTPSRIGEQWQLFYPEHLFLFDPYTLAMVTTRAGFTLVAHGIRDFDPWHLGIGEALRRLGLRPYPPPKTGASSSGAKENREHQTTPTILHRVAQFGLSAAVIALRRLDYIWLVARVP
jgi:2-polyprenyl-3-methyl-5-hydroxy-6-metoxy-1,4-benzoquinol methylase